MPAPDASPDAGLPPGDGLIVEPNLAAADDLYADLLAAHRGLSDADSQALNARLVLLLMNHVGDAAVIRQALVTARAGLGPGTSPG